MRILSLLLLSTIVILSSGCAYMGDSNKVSIPTAERENLAPLKTPPGMNLSFNTLYPIPHNRFNTVKQINVSPPALYVKKKAGSYS